MNEETIFDPKEVEQEKQGDDALKDEKTVLDEERNPSENETSKGMKKKILGKMGIAGMAGVGLGVLTPVNVFPDASEEGDDISGNHGTNHTPSPSNHLQGHDMEVATGVNDSMSFNQAFAAARQEVGPGGLFVWHGHTYGTYYANEWNSMSAEEQNQYWADVHHTTSNLNQMAEQTSEHSETANEEIETMQTVESQGEENVVEVQTNAEEEVVTVELDTDEEALAESETDSLPEVVIENEDGSAVEGVEVEEADGVAIGDEVAVEVDEVPVSQEEVQLGESDGIPIEEVEDGPGMEVDSEITIEVPTVEVNEDVDEFASSYVDPEIPIDNNMDMSDFV